MYSNKNIYSVFLSSCNGSSTDSEAGNYCDMALASHLVGDGDVLVVLVLTIYEKAQRQHALGEQDRQGRSVCCNPVKSILFGSFLFVKWEWNSPSEVCLAGENDTSAVHSLFLFGLSVWKEVLHFLLHLDKDRPTGGAPNSLKFGGCFALNSRSAQTCVHLLFQSYLHTALLWLHFSVATISLYLVQKFWEVQYTGRPLVLLPVHIGYCWEAPELEEVHRQL